MLEIDLQSYIVYINISNSNFTDWNDSKKIKINIHSSSPVMIIFYKCNFFSNKVTNRHSLIDFWYDVSCIPSRFYTTVIQNFIFNEVIFSDNEESGGTLIRFLKTTSRCFEFIHKVHLKFNNVGFYDNKLTIIEVDNKLSQKNSSILISTTGYFVAKSSFLLATLISLTNVQISFNGITEFSRNFATEIVHLFYSILTFSNTTVFHSNYCIQVISIDCKLCYLVMSRSACNCNFIRK